MTSSEPTSAAVDAWVVLTPGERAARLQAAYEAVPVEVRRWWRDACRCGHVRRWHRHSAPGDHAGVCFQNPAWWPSPDDQTRVVVFGSGRACHCDGFTPTDQEDAPSA